MKSTVALCLSTAVILLPLSAFAQSSDVKYCQALSEKYNTYVLATMSRSPRNPPSDVAVAMSKCSTDAKSAIPLLEKALSNSKVSLPSRS